MIIKIDTRETELLKKCQDLVLNNQKFKDVKLISETLPLGDVIINDGQNDCIIVLKMDVMKSSHIVLMV